MAQTISFSKGRLAPLHDMRIGQLPDNVDPSLIHNDCVFIDKLSAFNYDIEYYTSAKFQPYIDSYNEKQTRDDRKKTKPYVELLKEENEKLLQKAESNKKAGKKIATRKPTPIAVEYVVQFGNRETNGTADPNTDIEKNRLAMERFLEEFQKKYKHVDILLAVMHADEPGGTPHCHIITQWTGEGYKQGLERQISISKALECDGFERRNTRGDYAIQRWLDDVKDEIMENVLTEVFQEERDIKGEHRPHEDVQSYRESMKAFEQEYKEAEDYFNGREEEQNQRDEEQNQREAELDEREDEQYQQQDEINREYQMLNAEKIRSKRQVDSAKEEADEIVNNARIEAIRIKNEAEKQAREAIRNSACNSLAVDKLTRAFVRAHKPQFDAFMDEHEELWSDTTTIASRGSYEGLSL